MSEPRIGRLLVASLHQAIADLLPARLEFYESWISVAGLREGTIGLAPLSAVLSFLRSEGDVYRLITARAGEYAADWTVNDLQPLERRLILALPGRMRMRVAFRTVKTLVRDTYPGSRAIVRLRKDGATVDLRGSLFCEVREASMLPLCGFYAAATARVLELFVLPADARMHACRAAGHQQGCLMSVMLNGAAAPETAAAT
jgi:hypothetical protein